MFCIEYVTKNSVTNDFDYSNRTKLQVERYYRKTRIVAKIRYENALTIFVYATGDLKLQVGDMIISTNKDSDERRYKIIDLKQYPGNHFEIIGVL
jgi:hypothetical protein